MITQSEKQKLISDITKLLYEANPNEVYFIASVNDVSGGIMIVGTTSAETKQLPKILKWLRNRKAN